jgi:thiosulfate dehydrogenase (quinone) large subunit
MRNEQKSNTQFNVGLKLKAFSIVIVIIRIAMGWLMLEAGLRKLVSGDFTAASFLARSTGPFANIFHSLANNTSVLPLINNLVIWGEFAIGIALILGILIRFTSFWGAIMMLLYYLTSLPPATGWITQQVIFILIFIMFMVTGVGYLLGLDGFTRKFEINRRWLRFLLG